jgi:uncharacterized protein YkwD
MRIVLVLVAAAGFALSLTVKPGLHPARAAAAADCAPLAGWPAARDDLAAGVLSLVNAHRQALGLQPLTVSSALQASARWKAQHMAQYNYMAHDDPAPPVARTVYQRIAACGYTAPAGENIARWYPDASSVVAAWLSDAPHKANIEGGWVVTGIGAAVSATGVVYWAEDFGAVGSAPPPPPPTTTKPSTTTTSSTTTTRSTTTTPAPTTTSSPPATTTTSTTSPTSTTARRRVATCVVPAVRGLRVAKARVRVRRAGCGVRVLRVASHVVAPGRVAWQSPRARVHTLRGSVVTLAVRVAR